MTISSIVSHGISFVKTNVIPVIKAEQQKVTIVALSIFSLMAAYAVVRCCFRANKIVDAQAQKIIVDTQGRVLEGRIINSQLCGEGSITYSYEGGTIREEGNFEASLLEGKGKIIFNGEVIEEGTYKKGVLQNGKRNPYRKDTLTRGTLKQGDFNGDRKLQGKGNVKHSNGDKEEGRYENGVFVEGTKIYSCGRREIGHFQDGELDGPNGRQIFPDGSEFSGNFDQGQLNGEGERRFPETDPDGSKWIRIEKGIYKEGALIKTHSEKRLSADPLLKRCFRVLSTKLNNSCAAITSVFKKIRFS